MNNCLREDSFVLRTQLHTLKSRSRSDSDSMHLMKSWLTSPTWAAAFSNDWRGCKQTMNLYCHFDAQRFQWKHYAISKVSLIMHACAAFTDNADNAIAMQTILLPIFCTEKNYINMKVPETKEYIHYNANSKLMTICKWLNKRRH